MTLTAALFAGGDSRRMGKDKATLSINGEPLWARQLRILRALNPAAILVSARSRPEWCPAEIPVVLDEPPSRGPLSGLSAALKKSETTHLLALAVDLPRMTSGRLRKLWKLAGADEGVVPSIDGKFEPLCAIYPCGKCVETAAGEALCGQDFSLQSFLAGLIGQNQLRVFSVPDSERDNFLNTNSPEDFARAVAETEKIYVP
jgi:molybdopterin-guanine dinucleotide biosynthesis protein A